MRRIIAVINLHFIVATRKWIADRGSFKSNKPLIENNISILFIDCSTWIQKMAYYDPINNHVLCHHLTHRDDACKSDTSYLISVRTHRSWSLTYCVTTKGIMKYFKFSFALYESGWLFSATFVPPRPKIQPLRSDVVKKYSTTWQTNPTRILMNFTNCFSSLQICLIKM